MTGQRVRDREGNKMKVAGNGSENKERFFLAQERERPSDVQKKKRKIHLRFYRAASPRVVRFRPEIIVIHFALVRREREGFLSFQTRSAGDKGRRAERKKVKRRK